MLLRGETNLFVHSLGYDSVLIFNFSDIERGYKNNIHELHHQSLVKI